MSGSGYGSVEATANRFADAVVKELRRRCPDMSEALLRTMRQREYAKAVRAETHRRAIENCLGCQSWWRKPEDKRHTCGQ